MGRRTPRSSGLSVHTRHIVTSCGKRYSGNKITVDKLIELHRKKCSQCEDGIHSQSEVKTFPGLNQIEEHLKKIKKDILI